MKSSKYFLTSVILILVYTFVGATCSDGIMNGDEQGVDCGGLNCPPCLLGTQALIQNVYSHNQVSFYSDTDPLFFTTGPIESDLTGDRIIWSIYSNSTGDRNVYTAKTDGTEMYFIYTVEGDGLFIPPFVDISPNGENILFSDGRGEIYVANFDGTSKRILVDEIENTTVPGQFFKVELREAPQFGGSLADPVNVYFIHKDYGSNGAGQAAERAGLYFVPVNGTAPPTLIFSAKNVAELYGEDANTYSPQQGLFGPKVSDGNLILFGTNDYGDGQGSDLWTNLNTSFSLVTENASFASAISEIDISGDGNVVVWRDQLNDQYVIKDLSENTLVTYPRFSQFDFFGTSVLSTNYFGTNTLIRHSGTNNCVLIDAAGQRNFPLYVTKYASDSFTNVGSVCLAKSKERLFFSNYDDIGNIFMTGYGNEGLPSSQHPKMVDFEFGQNWVVENVGETHLFVNTASGASPIDWVNFVELNNPKDPASILNNFSNHYLFNDGITAGDQAIDDIFTHNSIYEQSYEVPQVPDTFFVRLTLFGESHYTSYDIYPFYLLDAPLSGLATIGEQNVQLNMMPNVVNDLATIQLRSKLSRQMNFSVVDISGAKKYSLGEYDIQHGENEMEINLSMLSKGVHFILVEDGEQLNRIKFIKL